LIDEIKKMLYNYKQQFLQKRGQKKGVIMDLLEGLNDKQYEAVAKTERTLFGNSRGGFSEKLKF